MTSKPVSALLADLGVTRSHPRPRVTNDNPFSEAQFKTLKYLPEFPKSFASLTHAHQHCADFFHEYNPSGTCTTRLEEVHSGIEELKVHL